MENSQLQSIPPQSVHVGLKIIAVLFYLVSIIFIVGGSVFTYYALIRGLAGRQDGVFGVGMFMGTIIMAGGISNFFVGSGLWAGKTWGKMLAIVVFCINFIFIPFINLMF